ncbi:MAG TPA: hypothetical protein VFQ22_04915 [Longimicrobiales bacterium]|nr:hypothetical protein [Longimicrobiales bacterium]
MKTAPAELPWWLVGEERCAYCGGRYPYEAEVRCAACDAGMCPWCAVHAEEGRLCPPCAIDAGAAGAGRRSGAQDGAG